MLEPEATPVGTSPSFSTSSGLSAAVVPARVSTTTRQSPRWTRSSSPPAWGGGSWHHRSTDWAPRPRAQDPKAGGRREWASNADYSDTGPPARRFRWSAPFTPSSQISLSRVFSVQCLERWTKGRGPSVSSSSNRVAVLGDAGRSVRFPDERGVDVKVAVCSGDCARLSHKTQLRGLSS